MTNKVDDDDGPRRALIGRWPLICATNRTPFLGGALIGHRVEGRLGVGATPSNGPAGGGEEQKRNQPRRSEKKKEKETCSRRRGERRLCFARRFIRLFLFAPPFGRAEGRVSGAGRGAQPAAFRFQAAEPGVSCFVVPPRRLKRCLATAWTTSGDQ